MATAFKEYILSEVLPEGPYYTEFDFSGNYIDAEGDTHEVTVFTGRYFKEQALLLFGNRKMYLPQVFVDAMSYFQFMFNQWKESRKELYFKQAYAYTLKYNPIENYSSREVLTNDITTHAKGSSNTRTFNNTDTRRPNIDHKDTYTNYKETETFHNDDTVTDTSSVLTTPLDTTTEEKMAFNSSQFSGDRKTSRGGTIREQHNPTGQGETPGNVKTAHTGHIDNETTGEHKLSETGYETLEHRGTITDAGDGTDTDTRNYTLSKTGNIGTMTPAEMLAKEFNGLNQDLAYRALCDFMERYTYYNDSIEGWW